MDDADADEPMDRRGFLRRTAAGTAGTAGAVGAAGTAAGQATTSGGGGGGTQLVAVGPGGNLKFNPAEVTVAPGTTVEWSWGSNNHNIVPSSQPESTSWKGTPGPPEKTYGEGYTYSHTFNTVGTYEYFCQPHKAAGMTGAITVQQGGASSGGEPAIPKQAVNLGVAATTTMLSTLGLAYVFMKYGGDYGDEE